jgi:hypothetical protein
MARYFLVTFAVNLPPMVSRPVCPGVRRPSGTCDQFFFLLEISFRQLRVCNFVAHSLTRGRVCKLLYNCFCALPEQSLLGRSPAELTAIFYCLIWDSTNLKGQVLVFRSQVRPWPMSLRCKCYVCHGSYHFEQFLKLCAVMWVYFYAVVHLLQHPVVLLLDYRCTLSAEVCMVILYVCRLWS